VSRPDATRRKSASRFALELILAIAVIVVAVYLLLLSDLNRVLRYRLDRLHSKGIPTNWAEVIPQPIPDEDNAAILYDRAFKLLTLARQERETLRTIFPADYRPSQGMAPNQAGNVDLKEVAQIIARNRPALDLLRQAAAKPKCRFPANWNERPYEVTLFPHYSPMFACARLLSAEAFVAAGQGDMNQFIDCYHTMLRIADHASSDLATASFAVASRTDMMVLASIHCGIQTLDLDPATCRALFDELQTIDLGPALRRAATGEGCIVFWVFGEVAKRPEEIQAVFTYSGDKEGAALSQRLPARFCLGPLGKLVRLREEIAYAERFERAMALAARPYRETAAAWRAAQDQQARLPPYYLVSRLAASFLSLVRNRDNTIAFRNAMQVALALKAYRAERGAYPDSLDALRGAGWTLPDDPFSGKPFGYRRLGPGFILYSWGEDLDDDGGRSVWPRNPTNRTDGDIVWSFPK